MVNQKTQTTETRKSWWSNNIVGVIITALLAALFSLQGMQTNQNYQDKKTQTKLNQEMLISLENLNGSCTTSTKDIKDVEDDIDDIHTDIEGLGTRVTVIETKIN